MEQKFTSSLPVVLNRHRWPAIATFVSVICGAIFYLAITPRQYESKVRLILEEKQLSISELGRDITTQPVRIDDNPIANQAELARSKSVLQQALNQVFPPGTPQKKLTVEQLKRGLKVTIIPATHILEIKYRNQDPELATSLLNAVSEAMVQGNTETIRSEARLARRFLEVEVPKKRQELAQAEAAQSYYKRSHSIVSLTDVNGDDSSQTKSLVTSLANLEDQERTLSAELQEAKARNNSLQGITDNGKLNNTYASVRINQDEDLKRLRTKLTELESQVAVNRSRFTNKNPSLLRLVDQRDATRALYNRKISRLMASRNSVNSANIGSDQVSQDIGTKVILGETSVSALEGKLAVVRKERSKLETRLNKIPVKQQEYSVLTRQRQEAATSLELLERKLDEARIAEAQLGSNLRISDSAELPTSPSWPSLPIVMVMATATGVALSIGIVMLLELLDGTLRNATEAEKLVKLPVHGVLPLLPKASLDFEHPELFLKDHGLIEPYRTLLKSMEFRSSEDLQVVVVSSTLSGEGKSVVASHLGAVSAMLSRRTLIIDADLRRPTQHKLFNLPMRPGLTDVIDGNVTLAEAVQQTNVKGLSVLTCGEPHVYPSQFFESERMRNLLAEAGAHYDLIIVDTPPVTSCVDAITLSRDSDRLLLVARPNFTQKEILMRAVSELASNRIGILGFAINGTTVQTEKFYRYALQGYQPNSNASNP